MGREDFIILEIQHKNEYKQMLRAILEQNGIDYPEEI